MANNYMTKDYKPTSFRLSGFRLANSTNKKTRLAATLQHRDKGQSCSRCGPPGETDLHKNIVNAICKPLSLKIKTTSCFGNA
jgi:hypothetical protein